MQYEDPSTMLDALSHRVLRHLSAASWRKLFLRPCHEVMHFGSARGTFLCAAAQVPAWSSDTRAQRDIEFLAHAHGGELDPCPQACALVRFDDAEAALAMAIELQRTVRDVRYQVGIASGDCTLATLHLEGALVPVHVGGAVERAEAVARQASPGSIRLAPETYAQAQGAIAGMGNCMLATEYDGEHLSAASLMLTPPADAFLSTFAGLGLT